jgi:hypothetical protein
MLKEFASEKMKVDSAKKKIEENKIRLAERMNLYGLTEKIAIPGTLFFCVFGFLNLFFSTFLFFYFIRCRRCNSAEDGNCQFASVSDQLYGDINSAMQLRQQACEWIVNNQVCFLILFLLFFCYLVCFFFFFFFFFFFWYQIWLRM